MILAGFTAWVSLEAFGKNTDFKMRLILLLSAFAFCGCAMAPNVNTRRAGQHWNYYGDLLDLYRDQTGGVPVALVWLDQVQYVQISPKDFAKTIKSLRLQVYRKIGFVSVRSEYFVDPYEVKKLAADKGAKLVVGSWFEVPRSRSRKPVTEYWYQLLDR
jgi:hypothetical protein